VFQVALASYALFSADRPSPAAVASALAVVLLPFSVLGPFAGVFLDRWSRRQVLLWANLARVGIAAVVAALVALQVPDPLLYAAVLVCLSVNRFLLAGLSAALPHTVAPGDLVTANALTPTAGTAAFVMGLAGGALVRAITRPTGMDGDVVVLAVAAGLYGAAGLLALRIPRSLLGPDFDAARPAARRAVGHVLSGLADGLRHLAERRPAAFALLAIGAHRFWFGLWSVSVVLLPRGGAHPAPTADAAFAEVALVALVTGAGLVAAAVLTPWATLRVRPRSWVVVQLLVAAAAQLLGGAADHVAVFLVAAFVLGTAAQGVKICVDTLVQSGVDDAYRGRVFSLYDVGFNVVFVAAAWVGALTLPADGRSPWLTAVLTGGYLLTAAGYAALTRRGMVTDRLS
jgi:MFS family permease